MNPLTNIKNLRKLTERELELGNKKSWHDEYKNSAWIFVGGLPYDLTEGDVICIFSQYGEIVNINLVRDSKTGKSRGYGFICYQDQRSTILSVDNLNGAKVLGRQLRVDHVKDYKMPKERGDEDEATLKLREEGCAPRIESSPEKEVKGKEEDKEERKRKKALKKEIKKEKKNKKKKKKKKKKGSSSSEEDETNERVKDESSSDSGSESQKSSLLLSNNRIKKEIDIKEEKFDRGYDNALKRHSHIKPKARRHDSSSSDESEVERRSKKFRRKEGYDSNRTSNGSSQIKEEKFIDDDNQKRRSREREFNRESGRSLDRGRRSWSIEREQRKDRRDNEIDSRRDRGGDGGKRRYEGDRYKRDDSRERKNGFRKKDERDKRR